MNFSRKILAGALVALLLPVGSAVACTTTAWLGTPGANAAIADDPDTNNATNGPTDLGAVNRYSGNCGLMTAAAGQSWVTDNSPGGAGGGESIYRARFYVRPGQSNAQIFSATSADNGGGTEAIAIVFTGTAFQFNVNGATVPNATGINANQWYSIEIFYQASGAFSATVGTGGANAPTSQTVNSSVNAGALTIGSVRLGQINAGAGATTLFDEFDSSRSASTAIGRLCPGDANASYTGVGTTGRTVADAVLIRNEVLTAGAQLAPGQPDANDSGGVTVSDAVIIRNLVLLGQGACPAS